jgi:ribosomal protein S16
VVKIDSERANYWISKGAKPSETVVFAAEQDDCRGVI